MKIKNYSYFFIILIITSCSAPNYLPTVEEIDINPFGSYIEIENTEGKFLKGELIAIDSSELVILSNVDSVRQASVFPIIGIKKFKLKYAQPKDYSWRIPVYTISTLLHGFFLILTAPFNLIVTITVNASGSSDFEYSEKDMSLEKLKMFARFPQGIPSVVKITDLK